MSVIDLLRSPLAIAGIVGSVAIGGGLTVYVVRDGAPLLGSFPASFEVEVQDIGLRNEDIPSDLSLPVVEEQNILGGKLVYVRRTYRRTCHLLSNRLEGCFIAAEGSASGYVIRLDDDNPSTVTINIYKNPVPLFPRVNWDLLKAGLSSSSGRIKLRVVAAKN